MRSRLHGLRLSDLAEDGLEPYHRRAHSCDYRIRRVQPLKVWSATDIEVSEEAEHVCCLAWQWVLGIFIAYLCNNRIDGSSEHPHALSIMGGILVER